MNMTLISGIFSGEPVIEMPETELTTKLTEENKKLFGEILMEKLQENEDISSLKNTSDKNINENDDDKLSDLFIYLLAGGNFFEKLLKDTETSAPEQVNLEKMVEKTTEDTLNLKIEKTVPGKKEERLLEISILNDIIKSIAPKTDPDNKETKNIIPENKTTMKDRAEKEIFNNLIKSGEIVSNDSIERTLNLKKTITELMNTGFPEKKYRLNPERSFEEVKLQLNFPAETGQNIPEDNKSSIFKILENTREDLLKLLKTAGKLENHINEIKNNFPSMKFPSDFISQSPLLTEAHMLLKDIEDMFHINNKEGTSVLPSPELFNRSRKLLAFLEKAELLFSDKNNSPGEASPGNDTLKGEINKVKKPENILPDKQYMTDNLNNFQEKSAIKEISQKNNNFKSILSSNIDLSEQLLRKVNWKTGEKGSEAVITLEPESLGKLKIQINLQQSGDITAKFFARTEEARDLINQQLQYLREHLEAQGLKPGELSVFLENKGNFSQFKDQKAMDFEGKKYYQANMPLKSKEEFTGLNHKKLSTSRMDYLV